MVNIDVTSKIAQIAERYFNYMAQRYPVMCLSDEFYFFPRALHGMNYLDVLDSLNDDKIKQDISYVKNLKNDLEKVTNLKDIEDQIDYALLKQNMSTFLRAFEHMRLWQIDPTLYLKIILLGIEHLTVKLPFVHLKKTDIKNNLFSRIQKIPLLLEEAKINLKKVPSLYLKTAFEMINVSIAYFKQYPKSSKYIDASIKKSIQLLEDFSKFLKKLPTDTAYIKGEEILKGILEESFSYKKNLDEIFGIAYREYQETLRNLEFIAKRYNSNKTWQEILHQYKIEAKNEKELLRFYSNHIIKLRDFFKKKDVITIPKKQKIEVEGTPLFMVPVRASASYSCPITSNKKEPAFFYVTPDFGKIISCKKGYSSVHIEYIFVTAHETYPGHHLLDSIRKNLKNPIRQQIESPLFYEGWATYAERLIDELGYIEDPIQKLVGLRRQAWRAVRAMLDVGIRSNKLEIQDAEILLKNLGYTPEVVKAMSRHYVLTPGYQLCYTMGKYEIEKLKNRYAKKLGLKKFHDVLLGSGQIPFDLVEKRMELLCSRNS